MSVGACMQAFGTIGPMETAYYRATGKQLLLSEQNLMDCGWYLNNKACFGGYQVSSQLSLSHVILIACVCMLHFSSAEAEKEEQEKDA